MKLNFNTHPRQKIIIATIFTIVFNGMILGLIAWPSINTIKTLAEQVYEQRVELEKLYQRGQLLKQTLREYEEIKPSLATLNRIYINRGHELEFITTLEETAINNGVTHQIKLTAADPQKQTNNQLQYQLQINGNLTDFIRYLASLEALDFYININTLRLSSLTTNSQATNQPSPQSIQAILLATSYFKP